MIKLVAVIGWLVTYGQTQGKTFGFSMEKTRDSPGDSLTSLSSSGTHLSSLPASRFLQNLLPGANSASTKIDQEWCKATLWPQNYKAEFTGSGQNTSP